ncbi:MAG: hypothetical protein IPL89_12950 [Acidobacteria bacterium]|nr:hypothetical protein [Acidobacteriota bacterium]
MSLGYAIAIKVRRRNDPAMPKFLDLFAALVPGDILAAHGVILAFTTTSVENGSTIRGADSTLALQVAFFGLMVVSVFLYVAVHHKDWQREDYGRMLIPPAAFVGWTMLQRPTAFDAVFPGHWPIRVVLALLLALVLGATAYWLSYKPARKGH